MRTLFDLAAARAAADSAIEAVGAAHPSDLTVACAAIRAAADKSPDEFTSDLAIQLCDRQFVEPRLWGAAFRIVKGEGYIVATNEYRNSASVTCHGRPKRVWRKA